MLENIAQGQEPNFQVIFQMETVGTGASTRYLVLAATASRLYTFVGTGSLEVIQPPPSFSSFWPLESFIFPEMRIRMLVSVIVYVDIRLERQRSLFGWVECYYVWRVWLRVAVKIICFLRFFLTCCRQPSKHMKIKSFALLSFQETCPTGRTKNKDTIFSRRESLPLSSFGCYNRFLWSHRNKEQHGSLRFLWCLTLQWTAFFWQAAPNGTICLAVRARNLSRAHQSHYSPKVTMFPIRQALSRISHPGFELLYDVLSLECQGRNEATVAYDTIFLQIVSWHHCCATALSVDVPIIWGQRKDSLIWIHEPALYCSQRSLVEQTVTWWNLEKEYLLWEMVRCLPRKYLSIYTYLHFKTLALNKRRFNREMYIQTVVILRKTYPKEVVISVDKYSKICW